LKSIYPLNLNNHIKTLIEKPLKEKEEKRRRDEMRREEKKKRRSDGLVEAMY